MRTSIKGVSSNLTVNTVVLTHNRKDPINIYLFRCYKCGTAINQVQGLVWGIYAGYINGAEVSTINKCDNCHENYTFQSFESVKRDHIDTTLILPAKKLTTTFHCVFCRTQLMQYNNKVAVGLPELSLLKTPTIITCFLPTCGNHYYLNDIVEQEMI